MTAAFGAEVIKIEPPSTGDPLRKWRLLLDGTSAWWRVQSRYKRSLELDLRTPEEQGIVRPLGERGGYGDRELPGSSPSELEFEPVTLPGGVTEKASIVLIF